jgi:GNAT superfamily N-acetyltransferase
LLIGWRRRILEPPMARPPGFQTRPLVPQDDPGALALAMAAGAHGVYVHNALARGEGEGFAMEQDGAERGLCWFGARGNLIVLAGPTLAGDEVAAAIQRARLPWRIAMGPPAAVDALAGLCTGRPLVHRDQVYYACAPHAATTALVHRGVRAAERGDRDRLMQATLQLNDSDLHVDPRRVDRRWLRDSIDERIATRTTRVLGPVGAFDCKLDFGSDGPGGLMLEGVFTFPAVRGGGLATALVASCIAAAPGASVCLHVGRHNEPARHAYERAGMREAGSCRLLLLA